MGEEHAEEVLVFRTSTATKVADSFVAVMYAIAAFIFVPLMGVLSGATVLTLGGPIWLAVVAGLLTAAWMTRFGWAWVTEQIRFCVILHPEYIQVGEDVSRLDLDYEAVDEVVVTNNNSDGVGIGLSAYGRDLCVRLPAGQVMECFRALLTRCPNAVFTDVSGREYVSPAEKQPERVLLVIEKHKRKVGLNCLGALPFLILWATYQSLKVAVWLCGGAKVPQIAVPELFIYWALSVISVLGCFSFAITAFSKSREARTQRLEMQGSTISSK